MSYRVTRPIPFGSRSLPYQFRARRAMSGLGALVRGLGLTCPAGFNMQGPNPEFPNGVCLENCGVYTDVGAQYACSQRNQAAIDAAGYEGPVSSPTGYTSSGNCAQYPNAPGCPGYQPLVPAAPPVPQSTSAPPTYNPQLSFITSRGGTSVYPGDSWQISISGAPPNQAVSVLGVHPDGGSATQGYGNTNGSGQFSLSGTITADMVGNWRETWSVGGQQVGSFSFTVNPTPQQQSQTSAPATPPPSSSSLTQTYYAPGGNGGSTASTTDSISSFLSGIPWWGWAIAAGGGLMLLSGGKHGR